MSVCAALGLSINLACKVAESSIGAAAIAQLGSVAPNLDWGISITNHYLAEDLTEVPVRIERGGVHRPRGVGLGVEVREAQVNRFRVK
jgi:muconate cycloisomerase